MKRTLCLECIVLGHSDKNVIFIETRVLFTLSHYVTNKKSSTLKTFSNNNRKVKKKMYFAQVIKKKKIEINTLTVGNK